MRQFDSRPEVGIYQIRDGKIVRSQMLHADSADWHAFLERAATGR